MEKGDLGVAKVIVDLIEKGYTPFRPIVCESLPFDLIAYKDGKSYRIQVKYSTEGIAPAYTSWANLQGNHRKYYTEQDFEYFALYLPKIDKVIYPSVKFKGSSFRTELPDSSVKFYWWEDFVNFTDEGKKRSYKEFGYELRLPKRLSEKYSGKPNLKIRKVTRPEVEELLKMIWEKPTTELSKEFGVSDKAIEKWSKAYKIPKPPRGYWMKSEEERLIIKNNSINPTSNKV